MPGDVFRCASEVERRIEQRLLRDVRNHELIDDNKVIPDTYDISWSVDIDEMGVEIGRETTVRDAQGADIRQLPHLKRVSIWRWCDQACMGKALQGTGIVFSRKPDSNYLSVDETLDEESWADHIAETLNAARGVPIEFIVRDVYTVHGNLANARRAVEVARKEIDQQYRG